MERMDIKTLTFALGESRHVARLVSAEAQRVTQALDHLAPSLRAAVLQVALAEVVGDPTLNRWGQIGCAALEHIVYQSLDAAPDRQRAKRATLDEVPSV
jgi:hypothetical protein